MVRHTVGKDETKIEFTGLSQREVQIIKCLARGMSDHEIASQLILSLNTIKWYNRKIFRKLGVCSRTQAIARGHELHIFDNKLPDDSLSL